MMHVLAMKTVAQGRRRDPVEGVPDGLSS